MFLGFAFICELNGIMKWISFSTTFWSKQLSSEILVDLCFKKFKDFVVKSFGHVITVIKKWVSMSIIIYTLTQTYAHTYILHVRIYNSDKSLTSMGVDISRAMTDCATSYLNFFGFTKRKSSRLMLVEM